MDNWEEKSNDEIRYAQITMHEKYEVIKNEIATLASKINTLAKKLDKMDVDYANSKKVLDDRLKY